MYLFGFYEEKRYHSRLHALAERYREVDPATSPSVSLRVLVWPYKNIWSMENKAYWVRDIDL